MKLVQSIRCVFGRHARSRSHAWQDGAVFRSRCRGCGKPMHRERNGWIVDKGGSDAAGTADAGAEAVTH
ncbi:hypothetical protein [Sphingomonas soli]|uniref:hypothetical protein n=1 Tax=Sphingomonas soli TaxID=266127 RepID=UPI0008307E42|nr:hypothetical protein [Sphingomonas soli]